MGETTSICQSELVICATQLRNYNAENALVQRDVLNILRAARTQLKTTTMDTPFQRLNVRANKMKTNEEGTFYKKM